MITSASLLPDVSTPIPTVSARNSSGSTPSDGETPASFEDALQQQGFSQSNPPSTRNAPGTPAPTPATTSTATSKNDAETTDGSDSHSTPDLELPSSGATTPAPTVISATASALINNSPTNLQVGSQLRAMLVQATAQASPAKQPAPAKTASTNLPQTSEKNSTPSTTAKNPAPTTTSQAELPSSLSQAAILLASAQTSTAKTSAPTSPSSTKSGVGSDAGKSSAKNSSTSSAGTIDVSTLVAQASILLSNAAPAQTATTTATSISTTFTAVQAEKELPLSASNKSTTANAAPEKKSVSSNAEGIFLQSGATSSSTVSSSSTLLAASLLGMGDSSVNQSLTSTDESKTSSSGALSATALSLAGTANVEKSKAMNDNINFPEVELLSGSGANTLLAQNSADLHIQLSSNQDFHDALTQVMHIAQLAQENESTNPMRVAMEIQTPPGAIVNVYVSRQNDQWRAQLSTNDPQALTWVQNQMSSLKSSDLGVAVNWLPPQIESGPTINSSQDGSLSWDRGGQGQSNFQQQDERRQPGNQDQDEAFPDLAGIQSNPFMNTLSSLGRAA